jgi:hypothetical protein
LYSPGLFFTFVLNTQTYSSVFLGGGVGGEVLDFHPRRKSFWLMVSEVSVHFHLALLLWAHGRTVCHGRSCGKVVTGKQRERERKGPGSPYLLQGHSP